MKQFIRNISQKRITKIFMGLLLVAALIGIYVIYGIYQNVQKMNEEPNESTSYYPEYPKIDSTVSNFELIKKGEYLTKMGDCIACHTNSLEKGKTFAGGLPMPTPFGTLYTPNITPDKETGIGNWTQEQFNKAMREGVSPQGHFYYPAFPYIYFTKLSDDDLTAMKAYLDVIPAISQKNRNNEMVFPFNIRLLQLGWRLLFFYPQDNKPFVEDPNKSPEINRGAFIVEGLGHCAMCHSPSYNILSPSLPLGAPIKKYHLTGAKVQGYLAPDISSANLGEASVQDIVDVFVNNKRIGGGNIDAPPMLEVNRDSLQYLSKEDLTAIALYLKNVKSEPQPRPTGAIGKGISDTYCSGCHVSGAGGAPKMGDAADWEPIVKQGIDKVYQNAIHGVGGMPAKGTCMSCSDDDIKQAVDYMISSTTSKKTSYKIERMKPLTLEDGKRIYSQNCSVCHTNGAQNAPKLGDMTAWQPIVDAGFVEAYLNVAEGKSGHPVKGNCEKCTDGELKAAIKYMVNQSSTTKNFDLW